MKRVNAVVSCRCLQRLVVGLCLLVLASLGVFGAPKPSTLYSGLDCPVGTALDESQGRLYWVDYNRGTLEYVVIESLGQALSIHETLATGLSHPEDVELDLASGWAYVTTRDAPGSGAVVKVNLATGAKTTVASNLGAPQQLALDLEHQRAFAVGFDSGVLWRIDLATGALQAVARGLQGPIGVVVSSAGDLAYVAEQGAAAIRSYNLTSGVRVATISTVPALCGDLTQSVPTPFFLSWANAGRTALLVSQHNGQGRLDRIDLTDGSLDPVYEYASGFPYGIALASNGAVMYITSEHVLQRLDLHTTATSADLVAGFAAAWLAPKDQGSRLTCSLFAITACVEYEVAEAPGSGFGRLSVEFLIWAADEATGREGEQAMFYEAVQGLNAYGMCREELMPYQALYDPDAVPSTAAKADAVQYADRWQVHWIKQWSLAGGASANQLLAIKDAIAAGHPVACGMRSPIANIGHDILSVPGPTEVQDGHSIAFVGYRDDVTQNGGGVFIFRNSAGPAWGDSGYGTMCYGYVLAYANDILWLELGPSGSEVPVQSFEAESLPIESHVNASAGPQGMEAWGTKMWSGGTQLFGGSQNGGIVQLSFVVATAGTYRVRVLATAAPDFGILDVGLDGQLVGTGFDLYSGLVSPAGSLELGVRQLAAGEHTMCFKVAGKNPASTAFNFGIDRIDLLRAP